MRRRSRTTLLVLAVVLLVAASAMTGAYVAVRRDRRLRAVPARAGVGTHPMAVEERLIEPEAVADVVRIVNGRLQIDSIDAWRDFAVVAIEEAQRLGFKGPAQILAFVFRAALPRYPWPPDERSSLYPQWAEMVQDVAQALHFEPEPDPQKRRFQVVS